MYERQVYLPKECTWTDIHTGEQHSGAQWITVKAPLHQIPVFIRDNLYPEWVGKI